MQIRNGIFFQSLAPNDTVAEAVLPSDYQWELINDSLLMKDSIFDAKDRRMKARARLTDGHACYGFLDTTGAVAYYMWITTAHGKERSVPWELNTRLILKPNTGYFWDCFTAPEHRRRGLYRAALRTAVKFAETQGIEKSYICCMKENIPSIHAIRSAGFHDIFEFTVRRIGPLVMCKRSAVSISVKFGSPKFDILD